MPTRQVILKKDWKRPDSDRELKKGTVLVVTQNLHDELLDAKVIDPGKEKKTVKTTAGDSPG